MTLSDNVAGKPILGGGPKAMEIASRAEYQGFLVAECAKLEAEVAKGKAVGHVLVLFTQGQDGLDMFSTMATPGGYQNAVADVLADLSRQARAKGRR